MPNGPYDCPSLVAPWSQQLSSCTPSSKDTPTNIYRNSWTRHSKRSRVLRQGASLQDPPCGATSSGKPDWRVPPNSADIPVNARKRTLRVRRLDPNDGVVGADPQHHGMGSLRESATVLSRVWGVIRTAMSDLHRAFLRAQQELLGGHKRGRHLIALLLSPPALYMLVSKCLYARDRLPENECMYILQ